MNQKGFVNILLTIVVVALVGAGVYVALTKQNLFLNPIFTPNLNPSSTSTPILPSTPISKPSPTPQPTVINNEIITVVDLNQNKENFVGKQVKVAGKVHVNVFFGALPCQENDPLCDTSMGAQLELRNNELIYNVDNFVLLFKNKQPYPCDKIASATYQCGPYTSQNDESVTISGVWSKDQVPIQWVGTSGGKPPTPVKWGDRYFLNIE